MSSNSGSRTRRRLHVHVAPPLVEVHAHGLDEQAAGERRRVFGVQLPQHREAEVARGLWSHQGRDAVGAVAPRVLLVGAGDLGLGRRLPRRPQAAVVGPADQEPALGAGRIQELRRLVGVEVLGHRRPAFGADKSRGEPEPQLVPLDRPAGRGVEVPIPLDLVWRRQSGCLELVGEVVAGQTAVGEGEEGGRREPVAAVPRDEVDAHAARRQLGRYSRVIDGHFGRRPHVRNLAADVAARLQRHGVDAVERHALILLPAAVNLDAAARALQSRAADVGAVEDRGRNHPRQAGVVARTRQRVDRLGAQDGRARRGRDIHGRRLAGDGDGLFQRADAQIHVDHGPRGAAESNGLPLAGVEARQCERDGVGARPQVDHLVAAVVVGDGGADLLDQHRAGGFHRDARKHRA